MQETLSDREQAVLDLLATGHDIKSAAATLSVSTHTVTDRLRAVRRKTGITSSREAARRLGRPSHINSAHTETAIASAEPGAAGTRPGNRWNGWPMVMLSGGMAVLGLVAGGMVLKPSPPTVTRTSPANGERVTSREVTVRVTFSEPMRAESYSFVVVDRQSYPSCDKVPLVSADRMTFSLRCLVSPSRRYAVGFNGGRFQNFRSARGVAAQPFVLRFATAEHLN